MPIWIGVASALHVQIVNQLARPFLVLLARSADPRLHTVIGVGPFPACRRFRKKLIVPKPSDSSRFDQIARTRVFLPCSVCQMIDGRVLQHRVSLEWLGKEPLRHRRGSRSNACTSSPPRLQEAGPRP